MLNTHGFELLRVGVLCVSAVAAAAYDVRLRIVPNWLSGTTLLLALLLGAWLGVTGLEGAVLGAAVFGGPMVLFWLLGWCGAGDAKIGFAFGALLGFPLAVSGLLLGTVAGGVWCLLLILYSLARQSGDIWRSARGGGLLGAWVAVKVNDAWTYGLPYALFLGLGCVAALVMTAATGGGV